MSWKNWYRNKGIFIGALLVLTVFFGFYYLLNHAYGASGDDSPGYIFLTHKIYYGLPYIYKDELVAKGIAFFGDLHSAEFLAPKHFNILSQDGAVASRYPIGLSWLMAIPALIFQNLDNIYLVVPFSAILSVLLVFFITYKLTKDHPCRVCISFFAALLLGFSRLYSNYATAQPMRDIPSIFFILLSVYFLLLARDQKKWKWYFIAISGLSLGFSFDIRHTGIAILPAIALFLTQVIKPFRWKEYFKIGCVFCLPVMFALTLTVWNSSKITQVSSTSSELTSSSIVLVSNIDHIESLSLSHLFVGEGKFNPGKGGLAQYWDIMQKMSEYPFLLVLVAFGLLVYGIRENKILAIGSFLWIIGFVVLFGMWINPYSRYILPAFPVLAIFGSYGLYWVFRFLWQARLLVRIPLLVLLASVLGFGASSLYTHVYEQFTIGILDSKAMFPGDLNNLKNLAGILYPDSTVESRLHDRSNIVIFSGATQFSISEMFENHTGVHSVYSGLDQKYPVSENSLKEFYYSLLDEGYHFFIWEDETTSQEFKDWASASFELKYKTVSSFSFAESVIIYEVLGTKNLE